MERTQRPGLPLVGMLAVVAGATIAVSAVVTAVAGERQPAPATTSPATREPESLLQPDTSEPATVTDATQWQLIEATDGSLSFEAPRQWPTLVFVSTTGGSAVINGAGAVATTYDDYKAATTEGIVAVATDPTEATSAGLQGALIGNSGTFCPTAGCTTGKITELPTQLPSSLTQVDFQYGVAPPGTGALGELRYTIETASPTRYVVLVVRAEDPFQGEEILEHALATLKLR